MVPTCGLIDQVTAVLVVPLTVGVKVTLCPPSSDLLPGDKLILTVGAGVEDTGFNISETVAFLLGCASLVAVTVSVCCVVTLAGAV